MESYDSLYDTHALEVIGIENAKKESDASGRVYEQGSEAQATSDSKISVADLLDLVKGDARKYIPEASQDTKEQAYTDAVDRGDMATAQKMVDQAAKEAGYNSPILYHGTRSFGFTEFGPVREDIGPVRDDVVGAGTRKPLESLAVFLFLYPK